MIPASLCKGSGASTSAAALTTRWPPSCSGIPASTSAPGRFGCWATRARFRPRLPPASSSWRRADPSVTVRCQLAATARRLSGARRLADRRTPASPRPRPGRSVCAADALVGRRVQSTVRRRAAARGSSGAARRGMTRAIRENALRLVRRYAAEGTAAGYEACARLWRPRREIPRRRPGGPRPRPGRAGRIAGRDGYGRTVRVGRDARAEDTPPPARAIRAAHHAVSRRHLDRLARRPGRRARGCASPPRAGLAGASSAVLIEVAAPRPRRRGDACCSVCSPSWDRREASRSPSPCSRGITRSRCTPRRSTCWPATATTK